MKQESITPRKKISAMTKGDRISSFLRLAQADKRKKRDGGDFLILEFMDSSGRIGAKIWDGVPGYEKILAVGNIYLVSGEITEYNQKLEIRLDKIRAILPEDGSLVEADFLPASPIDQEKTFQDLLDTLNEVLEKPELRKLVDLFAGEYGFRLQSHYGAQRIHHAYPGGLLEHTAAVVRLALVIADMYQLDKELLAVGALLHDCGKMLEFSVDPLPETTLAGGLLGHIVLGNEIFITLAARIPNFPENLRLKIQHLLVAHHGEKDFGSPEVPKSPEAYALHMIDMLDSKLHIFRQVISSSTAKGCFSDYQNLLGTRILMPEKNSGVNEP